jgi:toxin-antitoxin system PIN domain toxin
MILVDANLLIYAYARNLPQHEPARSWLDGQLGANHRVGLPWSSLLTFLRIVTNPRIFTRAVRIEDAWAQVLRWLSAGPSWIPQPTDAHTETLGRLLAATHGHGTLVPDADLAALAIEHGLILYSADGDFARFEGLRWENPLA